MLKTLKVTLPDGDVVFTREKDNLGKYFLTEQNTLLVTDELGRTIAGFVAGIWLRFESDYTDDQVAAQ